VQAVAKVVMIQVDLKNLGQNITEVLIGLRLEKRAERAFGQSDRRAVVDALNCNNNRSGGPIELRARIFVTIASVLV
jgi:hypothetical protein